MDDQLAAVLASILQENQDMYDKVKDEPLRNRISYIIGTLETVLKVYRPEQPLDKPSKGWGRIFS